MALRRSNRLAPVPRYAILNPVMSLTQSSSACGLDTARALFARESRVRLAFLFGSRARQRPGARDWDFAVSFAGEETPRAERLGELERLRQRLGESLGCGANAIDLVDLRHASLGMLATVAGEGILLKGADTLEAFQFYQRAWRGLEEFHFRKSHGL